MLLALNDCDSVAEKPFILNDFASAASLHFGETALDPNHFDLTCRGNSSVGYLFAFNQENVLNSFAVKLVVFNTGEIHLESFFYFVQKLTDITGQFSFGKKSNATFEVNYEIVEILNNPFIPILWDTLLTNLPISWESLQRLFLKYFFQNFL